MRKTVAAPSKIISTHIHLYQVSAIKILYCVMLSEWPPFFCFTQHKNTMAWCEARENRLADACY